MHETKLRIVILPYQPKDTAKWMECHIFVMMAIKLATEFPVLISF